MQQLKTKPNRFNADTAAELCNHLTARQQLIVKADIDLLPITPLLKCLPSDRPELRAIAVILADGLHSRGKSFVIPSIRFDNKIEGESHQGVFTVDDYELNFQDCFCLTEDWKESAQCQTLPQEITDLILWMID